MQANLEWLARAYAMPYSSRRRLETLAAAGYAGGGVNRTDEIVSLINDHVSGALQSIIDFMIEHAVSLVQTAMFRILKAALSEPEQAKLAARPDVVEIISSTLRQVYGTDLRKWMHLRAKGFHKRMRKLPVETIRAYMTNGQNWGTGVSRADAEEYVSEFERLCRKEKLAEEEVNFLHAAMVFLFRCELRNKVRMVFESVVHESLSEFAMSPN